MFIVQFHRGLMLISWSRHPKASATRCAMFSQLFSHSHANSNSSFNLFDNDLATNNVDEAQQESNECQITFTHKWDLPATTWEQHSARRERKIAPTKSSYLRATRRRSTKVKLNCSSAWPASLNDFPRVLSKSRTDQNKLIHFSQKRSCE